MNLNTGHSRLIINVSQANGLLRNQVAYLLATAHHETGGTFQPVRETFATSDKQAIARLDAAWAKGQLKWVKRPYWRTGFFGRGFVQLTHEANYAEAGRRLGNDFVTNPSLVMKSDYAARILVLGMRDGWFTGKKLSDYITLQKSDFKGARRIINGTDKASLIAGYAKEYDRQLEIEGYGENTAQKPVDTPKPVPAPTPQPKPATRPAPASGGFWAFLKRLFTRKG